MTARTYDRASAALYEASSPNRTQYAKLCIGARTAILISGSASRSRLHVTQSAGLHCRIYCRVSAAVYPDSGGYPASRAAARFPSSLFISYGVSPTGSKLPIFRCSISPMLYVHDTSAMFPITSATRTSTLCCPSASAVSGVYSTYPLPGLIVGFSLTPSSLNSSVLKSTIDPASVTVNSTAPARATYPSIPGFRNTTTGATVSLNPLSVNTAGAVYTLNSLFVCPSGPRTIGVSAPSSFTRASTYGA
ncbi:MAG TPA: hypothetical protein PLK80_13410, partial [bacterium]|nr:hypothetical protein [bacterium]